VDRHSTALLVAGIIGIVVAVLHGVLTHRLMVRPFQQFTGPHVSATIRRLVPLQLQFSTYNWAIGGIALIVAATRLGEQGRLVTGLLAGSSYLFGAVFNLYGTRTFHPGWVLYTAALILIAYGLT